MHHERMWMNSKPDPPNHLRSRPAMLLRWLLDKHSDEPQRANTCETSTLESSSTEPLRSTKLQDGIDSKEEAESKVEDRERGDFILTGTNTCG